MVNIACIKFAYLHTEFVKLLAIDRGNSRTKVGLRNEDGDLLVHFFRNEEESNILLFIQSLEFDACIMSSVGPAGSPLYQLIYQTKHLYSLTAKLLYP